LVLLIPVLGGCGSSSPTLVAVEGRVMEGAKPVAGASVNYQPIATSGDDIAPGPSSFGITDAEGRYQLRTLKEDSVGAVAGQHHVYISLDPPVDQVEIAVKPPVSRIPKKFADGSTVVDVPAASGAAFDFDIALQ
jgi:hypothetical protein